MAVEAFTSRTTRESISATGLWRINAGGVVAVDPDWPGPLTVLAPSERILILVVDLPFASRAQRVKAAPFAVEGLIAEPIERVHVALGAEVSDRRHLCAVVRSDLMDAWIAILIEAGLDHCMLVPDALSLPIPPPGAWRVAVEGGRAIVRTDDGSGFGVEVEALPATWEAGNRPRLIASGEPLPEIMQAGVDDMSLEIDDGIPSVVVAPVDLRQGRYAPTRRLSPTSPWRIVALVAGAGVLAHVVLLALDTWILHGMADRREAETRAMIAARSPELAQESDLVMAVERLAPLHFGSDGRLIRTLGRVSTALDATPMSYRYIEYASDGSLNLAVSVPDAATLEGATAALNGAALPARSALAPVAAGSAAPDGVAAIVTITTVESSQ